MSYKISQMSWTLAEAAKPPKSAMAQNAKMDPFVIR